MYQTSLRNSYGQLPVSFRVSIQYDQLIMFDNFYEYINEIYGNLKLKLRVSPDALVWCCVDPQYSLLHGVTSSFLETVNLTVGSSGNTKQIPCDVPILKHCSDNFTIKSVNDVYTKRFIQLNSYGRACKNVLAGGNGEVEESTNNLVLFVLMVSLLLYLHVQIGKLQELKQLLQGIILMKQY
jgi:hypothetical protein